MRGLAISVILVGLSFSNTNNSIPHTPSVHNRFYQGEDRNFWAERFDFSGIGWVNGGQWATMITEHGFVAANHYKPAIGSTLKLYPYNNTSVVWTGKVVWTASVYGDATVGILESAPPLTIARYPIISKGGYDNWTESTNLVYVGRVGSSFAAGTTAIGYSVNPGEDFISLTGFRWRNGGWEWLNDHFATGRSGDSGAPTLMFDEENRLSLVGTHYTPYGDAFYAESADRIDEALALAPIWAGEKVRRSHNIIPKPPIDIFLTK